MADNTRTLASIFLDLEAVSDLSSSESEEELVAEDREFIDDSSKPTTTRASIGSRPRLDVDDEFANAETIAESYVARAKRARIGPAPYDAECSNSRRDLFPDKAGDVDDSEYRMYMMKHPKPRYEVYAAKKFLPPNCLVIHVPVLPKRVYYWVPDASIIHSTYRRRLRGLDASRLIRVPRDDVDTIFAMLTRDKVPQARTEDEPREFRVGNWVQVRSGSYAGDLGIVRELVDDNIAKVAVVPRLQVPAFVRPLIPPPCEVPTKDQEVVSIDQPTAPEPLSTEPSAALQSTTCAAQSTAVQTPATEPLSGEPSAALQSTSGTAQSPALEPPATEPSAALLPTIASTEMSVCESSSSEPPAAPQDIDPVPGLQIPHQESVVYKQPTPGTSFLESTVSPEDATSTESPSGQLLQEYPNAHGGPLEPFLNAFCAQQSPSVDSLNTVRPLEMSSTLAPHLPSEQAPALESTSSEKPPALEVSSSEQAPALEPTSSEQPPALEVSSSEQAPALEPTSSEQPPALEVSSSEQTPALEPTSSEQPPALDATSSAQPPTLEPTASEQPPAVAEPSSEHPPAPESTSSDKAPGPEPTVFTVYQEARHVATIEWLKATFPKEHVSECEEGHYMFKGDRYKDGLRILRLCTDLHIDPAQPTPQDVYQFCTTDVGIRMADLGDLRNIEFFMKEEDVVQVMSGRCSGMVGVVEKIEGTFVLLDRLRKIHLPEGSNADRAKALVQRWEALGLMSEPVEFGGEVDKAKLPINTLRRLLEKGDEVVIRAGLHTGRKGLIMDIQDDILTLFIDPSLPLTPFPCYWVETPDEERLPEKKEEYRPEEMVMVVKGHLKGYVKRIYDTLETGVVLQFGWTPSGKPELVDVPYDSIKKVAQSVETGPMYEKIERSPFIGMFVLIRNADGKKCTDLHTKIAKGKYGYVVSVDEENCTAKVALQGTDVTIPLRNLISFDYVCCLESSHALTRKEAQKYSERFREYVHCVKPRFAWRWMLPTSGDLTKDMRSLDSIGPVGPVADLSGPGMWIFDPQIQNVFSKGKVYVRVRSQNRLAYISETLQDDHRLCRVIHTNCRVRVFIIWSRTVSETEVDVSDLEPALPKKKGQVVVQIRNFGALGPRILTVTGLPKHHAGAKVIRVRDVQDELRTWEMPVERFTTFEPQ